jgi:GTP-binding protein
MAGEFLLTLGEKDQVEGVLRGDLLGGHSEPRVAMIGRSNVGKSSLINAMMGGKLAQVSKTPGKTREIHFYLWKDTAHIIADLPGYGFARTAQTNQERWTALINSYFRADSGIERALVLLDARHGPTKLDYEAIRFLSFKEVPVTFVFTKADQLKTQSMRAARHKEAAQTLEVLGLGDAPVFWVSSRSRQELDELIKHIAEDNGGLS